MNLLHRKIFPNEGDFLRSQSQPDNLTEQTKEGAVLCAIEVKDDKGTESTVETGNPNG